MNWYALFVETGHEEEIRKYIDVFFNKNILYSLIPRRKLIEKKNGLMKEVIKEIYPGYVLIKTNMDFSKYYMIKKIPYLIRILGIGTYYTKLENDECTILEKLFTASETLDYSTIYTEDSKVIVMSGPLVGMEAIIKKIDKHKKRAKILLNFMGELRMVDVGIKVLTK